MDDEDLRNKSPQETHANRIDVEKREDVRWWCQRLGCNEMRLKNAVRAVGPSAEAVIKYMTKEEL